VRSAPAKLHAAQKDAYDSISFPSKKKDAIPPPGERGSRGKKKKSGPHVSWWKRKEESTTRLY